MGSSPGRPAASASDPAHADGCQPIRLPTRLPTPSSGPGQSDLLDPLTLAALNRRRNRPAWIQLLLHGGVLLSGALLWSIPLRHSLPWGGGAAGWWVWPLGIGGLLLLGSGLAMAFCALHECSHRTAFRARALNDAVAWWAGVLSFYNADVYRRYHQWHHRYTHLPGLDPELEEAPPTDLRAYLLELSGLPWWSGKIRGHWAGWRGDFGDRAYISAEAIPLLRRSLRLQILIYALLALASIPGANGFLLWYWLLPLAVGQPLLRFVLMAEHGACPFEADGLRNTRTTLTLAPLRRLMWNMPFHAEHHLYPSLPFHALAEAHRLLAGRLEVVSAGYLAVHRQFLGDLGALALPTPAEQRAS